MQAANFVGLDEGDSETRANKLKFSLRRAAQLEPTVTAEYLFGALLSSKSQEDVRALNPYLSESDAGKVLEAVAVTVLRANRIGQGDLQA